MHKRCTARRATTEKLQGECSHRVVDMAPAAQSVARARVLFFHPKGCGGVYVERTERARMMAPHGGLHTTPYLLANRGRCAFCEDEESLATHRAAKIIRGIR